MQKTVLIIVALALAAAVAFGFYSAFSGNEKKLDFADVDIEDANMYNGHFSARFKSEKPGFFVSHVEYRVVDNGLYITVIAVPDKDRVPEADSEGYTKIEFDYTGSPGTLYYYSSGNDYPVGVSRRNGDSQ